ncbi:unnamed protein product [Pieris brassicae]|uniref:CUB domain-containing protein n=1 Tax=Pieris brassicae TaxID=7116 RepID=A0A9P0SXA5_PIEBR|nr:unnamed protein product [Pieris brassicae]
MNSSEELAHNCSRGDYIKVYWEVQGPGPPGAINERSGWAKQLCGGRADIPPALYSPGQSLVLEFHTGARQNNATGFLGTFSFIDKLTRIQSRCLFCIELGVILLDFRMTPNKARQSNLSDELGSKIHCTVFRAILRGS